METTPPKFCEACGKPLVPGTRFCEECGHPVAAVTTVAPPAALPRAAPVPLPAELAPAAPLAPPPAAVAVPNPSVRGGSGIKVVVGIAAVVVLSGLGVFISPAGKQFVSRFTGRPPAVPPNAPATSQPIPSVPAPPVTPVMPQPPVDLVEDATVMAQRWVDKGFAKEQAGNLQGAVLDYQQALKLTSDHKLAAHIQQLKTAASNPAPAPQSPAVPPPPPASVKVTPQLAQAAATLHETGNIAAVTNGATRPNTFIIAEPMLVTYVRTYHWNNGKGKTPGLISLTHEDGTQFGPWQASGIAGQGGVPNASWTVAPGVVLKPGKYTLLDSHPTTWSQNAATGGLGMCEIKGLPWRRVSVRP